MNQFSGMSLTKLRFEHEMRQRAISELTGDLRDEYHKRYEFISRFPVGGDVNILTEADIAYEKNMNKIQKKIDDAQAELKLIEEAMPT